MKEGEEINLELKELLSNARKKSSEILSESDRKSKSDYSEGRLKFLSSVQDRLSKTKSLLKTQELEVEKNIVDGIGPLTTDIVVKSSDNILSEDKVKSYLNSNISSLRKNLKLRGHDV
jgi:F0F1-type ATP synthase membrane subunit b/b'